MIEFASFEIIEFFELVNGKPKYIRDYIDAHSGKYPVYSASLNKPFGFIDTFDFTGPHLTWVMNGYGGRTQVVDGMFSANRDRGVFVPKEGIRTPDLTYLRFAVEPELVAMAVGRIVDGRKNEYTKVYPAAASTASVSLPVTDAGAPDYDAMARIGARLRTIEQRRVTLAGARDRLAKATFGVECDPPFVEVGLSDENLFAMEIGERVLLNEATAQGIPLFSANSRVPFGYLPQTTLDDLDRPSLLWGIDGVFDWNLIPSGEPFDITDHCGRLQILDSQLDPEYVYCYLRSTRAQYGFDRVFRASLGNMRAVVTIKVPVDHAGDYDLNRQRKAAASYQERERNRASALLTLDEVLKSRPSLSAVA